jgi:hypothetical protein
VRAITRVADDENELELLEHARSMSASALERLVRSWRRLGREDEAALERRRHESRCLSVFPDDDGMYLVRGKLDPEVGALLMRAIEAASDALYRGSVPGATPEQRRADALALLAERAMAVGFAPVPGASAESSAESPALEALASAPWRSERYLVVLHVDTETLARDGEPGHSDLEDGTRVSAESSRRLACDTSVVRVVHEGDGGEVQIQGKTRTVPLRLRRALEIRDRGCRFPGCGSRFTDAHHIEHWADGGATRLDNLILLCKTHHRLLHEGGFRLERDPERPGRPIFYSPRGIRIPHVPPRMTLDGRPVGAREASPTGAEPVKSCPARWEDDVPLALYLRALEAIG